MVELDLLYMFLLPFLIPLIIYYISGSLIIYIYIYAMLVAGLGIQEIQAHTIEVDK